MWSAKSYLETYFIGQEEIVNGIHYLIDDIESGNNYNFIFRAPSGYGKTYLANRIVHFIHFKTQTRSIISFTGDKWRYFESKRFQLIDEVHLLKDPERIYPLMDSGKHTFMLMSNEYSDLLEPLTNRCFAFNFSPYRVEELSKIAEMFLRKYDINLGSENLRTLVENSRLMPREVINLCKRLAVIFKGKDVPESSEKMEHILFEYCGIRKGGFTSNDEAYLHFLRENQRASLTTLANVLQIPRQTVLNEIEPFLLRKNLIQITSRGRILNANI